MTYSRNHLMQAIVTDNHELMRRILDSNPELANARDLEHRTPAFSSRSVTSLELLGAAGASWNEQEREGYSLLHIFAYTGDIAMVEYLLCHGAEVLPNSMGQTAVHTAATQANSPLLQLLLEHGVDPNAKDTDGFTALFCATLERSLASIKVLAKHGADVNIGTSTGTTPLHAAALQGDAAMVRILLENGGNPYQPDSFGQTPLDMAENAEIRESMV